MAAFSSVVTEVTSVAELADIQSGKLVLFFWAAWHEPSQPGGQMDSVIAQLAADAANASLRFAKVEAEAVPELSERFAVSVVPTFVMMRDGDVADKFEGADVPSLVERVQAFRDRAASAPRAPTEAPAAEASAEDALNARLAKLIGTAPAMLFMCVHSTSSAPTMRALVTADTPPPLPTSQEGHAERAEMQVLAHDRGDAARGFHLVRFVRYLIGRRRATGVEGVFGVADVSPVLRAWEPDRWRRHPCRDES